MRGKQATPCLALVITLLLSYGAGGSAQAQPTLAGANMALPFARRSKVNQYFGGEHKGTDYRAGSGTRVVAANRGGRVESPARF